MEHGASPATIDDLLASTLSSNAFKDEAVENWMTGNPLTDELMKDDLVEEVEGSNDIREAIEYQNNNSAQWSNDATIIDTGVRQILTEMQASWKMLFGSVNATFSEEAKNAGKFQKIGIVKSRLNNLIGTFHEAMEEAFFAASPGDDNPWSLLEIIDSGDPTRANYGGIDRDTYTWWQGWEVDATSSGGFSVAGIETVRAAELATSKAMKDRVTMHFTSQTLYAAYMARLVQQEIISKGGKNGDLEFENVLFAGRPVYWSPQCPTTTWLGINGKHMKLFINKAMRFKDYGWTQVPGGLSRSKLIGTMCQLISKRPRSNFKIANLGA
jgi:hypothetical protein